MDQMLTRKYAMNENYDPTGRKWGIGKVIGTSLYHVDVLEGTCPVKPKKLKGKFTNPTLAQKALELYLIEQWDL